MARKNPWFNAAFLTIVPTDLLISRQAVMRLAT
jgi:hypothetical protein